MMIIQLCQAISLLLFAPLIAAAINITKVEVDQGVFSLSWTSAASDPTTFTIFFFNPNPAFAINATAIAENVPTSLRGLQLDLPRFPADAGYFVRFVSPDSTGEKGTVYAESARFAIDAEDVTKSVNTATFTLTYSAFTPINERVNSVGTASTTAFDGSTPRSAAASPSASSTGATSNSGGTKSLASVSLAIFGAFLAAWAMV